MLIQQFQFILLTLILSVPGASLFAFTSTEDSIAILNEEFHSIKNSDPAAAKVICYRILNLISMDDTEAYWKAQKLLSNAYYVNSEWDSLKQSLHRAIPYYEESGDHFMLAASYRNLAAIGEKTRQPDSSLYYLEKCFAVLETHPDTTVLGDAYISQGIAYDTKGYYELSLQAFHKALDLFKQIGSKNRRGYTAQNIGITLDLIGRHEEAIELLEESLTYFLAADNLRTASKSLNAIGGILRRMDKYAESISTHHKSVALAQQTKRPDVLMNNYLSLAKNYLELKNTDSTNYYLNLAEIKATDLKRKSKMGEIYRLRAELSLLNNDIEEARTHINKSEPFLGPRSNPASEAEQHYEMSSLYYQTGNYRIAYENLKRGDIMMDSVFTQNKIKQVEELHIIHQTKEKDAEIQLLNKNAEIDSLRKKILWSILSLLSLISFSIIYIIQQKRKRENLLHTKEQELSKEKQRNLELDLEFKQKELLTHALQLAKKNEFLNKLESEVSSLKSSVDANINNSTERISRMIQHDADDDNEWDQFSKEFKSLHQDFLLRLNKAYGNFTTNEIRLISLMKMNLSSKDIANILRISGDGIKKARYRLRKKINLDSTVNLQNHFLSF